MKRDKETAEYIGFTELDDCLDSLKGRDEKLASSALQFVFNGYGGFSFPAAHYPVKGVTAEELNHLTHRLIVALEVHGFTVSPLVKLRIRRHFDLLYALGCYFPSVMILLFSTLHQSTPNACR